MNELTDRATNDEQADATSNLRTRLQRAAAGPLPGRAAQRRFEPPWGFGRHFGPAPHHAVPAAVCVLIYPHEGRLFVPLTVRHVSMSAHAGQISLPGGRIDAGETDVAAAVRELQEELGIARDAVEPWAALTPLYIFGTNFDVRPWLAWSDRRPEFVVNTAEVAELLEVPLDDLCDARAWGRHLRTVRGVEQEVPHIMWQAHVVWGATAMILGELIEIIRSNPTIAKESA